MANTLGRHILCEAYECDPEVLDNIEAVREIMVDAALRAGAEIREVAFHKFSPQGVSGVVVISESHRTWPSTPGRSTGMLRSMCLHVGRRWTPWSRVDTSATGSRPAESWLPR